MSRLIRLTEHEANKAMVFMVPLTARKQLELQKVFGATVDKQNGVILYPAFFPSGEECIRELCSPKFGLQLSDAAKQHMTFLSKVRTAHKNLVLPEDFTFVTPPYQHQIEGLVHIFYMYRAALFHEPGLGKTKVVIDLVRLLHKLNQTQVVLVLGPLVVIRNWGDQIDLHSGKQLRWGAVLGTPEDKVKVIQKAIDGELDILLVTYNAAKTYFEYLNKVDYRTIVADESHYIKSWVSDRTQAAVSLSEKANRRIIMTGTPTLGNPLDLYGQFRFLGQFYMPEGYTKFKNSFVEYATTSRYLIKGYKNLPKLNKRVLPISHQRTKEQCLDLPNRIFINVLFDLTREQIVAYNELVDTFGLTLDSLQGLLMNLSVAPPTYEVPHIAVLLNKLSQIRSGFFIVNLDKLVEICDGCIHLNTCITDKIQPYTDRCKVAKKLPEAQTLTTSVMYYDNAAKAALLELLYTLLPFKCIIWCRFIHELNDIEQSLTDEKIKFIRVDGSVGSNIKERVDQFNDDIDTKVYLAQISTGVGVTLNAAKYMIFYNLDYSLGSYKQALDRNYRIGQTHDGVIVYHLLARKTIDSLILSLLQDKIDINNALMGPEEGVPYRMDKTTIKAARIGAK